MQMNLPEIFGSRHPKLSTAAIECSCQAGGPEHFVRQSASSAANELRVVIGYNVPELVHPLQVRSHRSCY